MLLDTYNEKGLLTIIQVNGTTSGGDMSAYRGDLVLKEGELREGSSTDRKPPEAVVMQAAMLLTEDKIKFINGLLSELALLNLFDEKYHTDLATDCTAIFYVENIDTPMQVELSGTIYQLIPYKEGMVWNEFLEELYIEKSDLKGQSAEDKVLTVYEEAKDYKSKGGLLSYEAAQEKTIEVVKDAAVGAV